MQAMLQLELLESCPPLPTIPSYEAAALLGDPGHLVNYAAFIRTTICIADVACHRPWQCIKMPHSHLLPWETGLGD